MGTVAEGASKEQPGPRAGARRRSAAARPAGAGKRLVIVESPAKARTVGGFLGSGYVVESSIGHIRDLPSEAAQVPEGVTGEARRLGVDVENEFAPVYVIPPGKRQQVAKLRRLLREADELYLATDEDREGESIAWHLREVLKPRVPVRRMVFHEITRPAIEQALGSPREVDEELVEAQEARRILDRLVGWEISPLLWRKVRSGLSAGRVQSVATRIIVDRERERMRFVRGGYWGVQAALATRGEQQAGTPGTVHSRLAEIEGRRVAVGRDFDAATGRLARSESVTLLDEGRAGALAEWLREGSGAGSPEPARLRVVDASRPRRGAALRVSSVSERPYTQRPPAPFVTSTLQQEASRKLRFTAQRTMLAAQQLYENGYITYMRTDSTQLSGEATTALRRQIGSLYGAEYLPDRPRRYSGGARRAQEAHEAIRPAGEILRTPESLAAELSTLGRDARGLYELVWKRAVASQMKDASGVRTQVRLEAEAPAASGGESLLFAASGKVIRFPGFLRAYVEGSDDPDAELEDQERLLPPLEVGQMLDVVEATAEQHETQPPARYTEASLVRELEERGIGRPSTYASILQTIQERGYVNRRGTQLVPTFTAFAVVQLLERHFSELVDLEFTARMEDDLDAVADGRLDSGPWLRALYFGRAPDAAAPPGDRAGAEEPSFSEIGLREAIERGLEAIDARAVSTIALGEDGEGRPLAVRVGRYGPFVEAAGEDLRADVPESLAPDELTVERASELLAARPAAASSLGLDPESGEPIYLRSGRYGPYVQLGEDPERDGKGKIPRNARKPRRASLWEGMSPETVTLAEAREILSFPKTLGHHPESGEPVVAQDGPRGPYLRAGDESRSLQDHDQLRQVTLEEALAILSRPRGGARRGAQAPLAELGPHPQSGAAVVLRDGRFGPYVTDGTVNASIPRGTEPSAVDLEMAVALLAAREQRIRAEGGEPGRRPRRSGGRRRAGGGRSG